MKTITKASVAKIVAVAVLCCLVLCCTTMGANAYFTDHHSQSNLISVGDNEITIDEDFPTPPDPTPGQHYTKTVKITNISTVPCYVRVRLVVSDSRIGDYLELNLNTTDWTYTDGYYYCNTVLGAGETTPVLLDGFDISDAIPTEDLVNFEIIVSAESVQTEGFANAQDAFAAIGSGST